MPEEGVTLSPERQLLSLSELERLVKVFAELGVRKVRLTGGEPLVRRDLEDIVCELLLMIIILYFIEYENYCFSFSCSRHADWSPWDTECSNDNQWSYSGPPVATTTGGWVVGS